MWFSKWSSNENELSGSKEDAERPETIYKISSFPTTTIIMLWVDESSVLPRCQTLGIFIYYPTESSQSNEPHFKGEKNEWD